MSASDINIPADLLLNCPTCGLPAEITDRFILEGVPTPVEHVKLVCVKGHWYTPPVDQLVVAEPGCQPTRRPGAGPADRERSPSGGDFQWTKDPELHHAPHAQSSRSQ